MQAFQREIQYKLDKKKIYFDNIEIAIMSFFLSHGERRNVSKVRGIIETAFSTGEELNKKGTCKLYGRTTREIALNLLAEAQRETNFEIYDEYYKSTRNKDGSFDYGTWQINDIHWKQEWSIYSEMKKQGLWEEVSNEWICHPRTNSIARVIIVNDIIKRKWGSYNRNDTLFKILWRIDGYKEAGYD